MEELLLAEKCHEGVLWSSSSEVSTPNTVSRWREAGSWGLWLSWGLHAFSPWSSCFFCLTTVLQETVASL